VQEGTRCQAGSTDISGIPVDFRGQQNNMAFGLTAIVMRDAFAQFWCK